MAAMYEMRVTNCPEKLELNLESRKVALELRKQLEKANCTVVLVQTRTVE